MDFTSFPSSLTGITNKAAIPIDDITGGTNNWAIKTGMGLNQFGDIVWRQGYEAADGTVGVTVSACTSFKNGLCVSGT